MAHLIDQKVTKEYALYNGDSCEVLPTLPDGCADISVYSPPFADLYRYSSSDRDLGNCRSYEEFLEHYRFIVEQMYRLTAPGRMSLVHCMDLGGNGKSTLRDFPGDIIRLHQELGFEYHDRKTIFKEPWRVALRTRALSLRHSQITKDASWCRSALPDYLLVFRKPGEPDRPISHENGFKAYPGTLPIYPPTPGWEEEWRALQDTYADFDGDQKENKLSHTIWRRLASPIWDDVRIERVLPFKGSKDEEAEKHVCLARGSLVLTSEGYVPIQDVQVGQSVLTHRGRWRPVLAVRRTGEQPTVKLRAQGVPGLTLTPGHRLWCRKVGETPEAIAHARRHARTTDPSWVAASDSVRSYVNLKPTPDLGSAGIPRVMDWWVVGRWLGDGHKDARGRLHISCSREEADFLVARLGTMAGHNRDTGTSVQIALKDKSGQYRKVLDAAGDLAHNKRLPGIAFHLDKRAARDLLEGYLSADGHYLESRNRYMASSVSKELLLGMAVLALKAYGAIASVYPGRGPRKHVIEGREVNARQDWVLSFDMPDTSRANGLPFVEDDGAWKKVRSIEDAGVQETWNLRVLEDESYTAEGCIVKNCPLQLDVIERAYMLWSLEGDTSLSPFGGVGSEPFQAVKMGRKAIAIELKPSYYSQMERNVEAGAGEWIEGQDQGMLF